MDANTRQQEDSRARLAAIRARRAATKTEWVTIQTTVGDILPGDFIEYIPAQHGFRGTRYDCLVTRTKETYNHYSYGPPRKKVPIKAIAVFTNESDVAALVHPASFKVMLRRPVKSST